MSNLPSDLTFHNAHVTDIPTATFYRIAALRQDVFVVEQDCVYLDLDGRDLDPAARQLWAEDESGAIAATVRILPERAGGTDDAAHDPTLPSTVSIGRVVTARAFRGRGIAGALLELAIAACEGREVELHAQSHLTEWYGRYSFMPDGEEYLEDGIPHTPMRLRRS
ncbi:GNAT family N-acetyltransferase [Leucobacter sp. USHLN153]|uniref:GNAT family N-acetyltransferase n=1 Tax=Leucobacter sp. USHLN153 TaxID=3081268 RepID=UPI00301A04E1